MPTRITNTVYLRSFILHAKSIEKILSRGNAVGVDDDILSAQ
jgi:hypothetical protein